MQVHLFGATSSPSCACFALQRTAEDHKDDFDKETVKTVDKNFYVDDCEFRLTKWASNSREVMVYVNSTK